MDDRRQFFPQKFGKLKHSPDTRHRLSMCDGESGDTVDLEAGLVETFLHRSTTSGGDDMVSGGLEASSCLNHDGRSSTEIEFGTNLQDSVGRASVGEPRFCHSK
jgi:hypothetical protein